MKLSITLTFILLSFSAMGQVGIGTENPNSSLEIKSSNQTTPSNTDGLIIPKADKFPAVNPGASQDGMMIFITGDGNVSKGFYSWDNGAVKWRRLSPSGLESILNSNGQAWKLMRESSSSHASPGNGALDLSFSDNSSGALGTYSTVIGYNTNATNFASFASGQNTIATGQYSLAAGTDNQATGYASATFNRGTRADAFSSFAVGSYNIGQGNSTQWVSTDPIFEVGNGTVFFDRSNALTILKNGKVLAPSLSIAEITDNKSLITKEYADANFIASGLEKITEGGGSAGWRLLGYDPVYYENIGGWAVDLSFSDQIYTPPPPPAASDGVGNGASGAYSFAVGRNTIASGLNSFAAGYRTNARCQSCTAIGINNIGTTSGSISSDDPLFEIGNGGGTYKSNAFTVLRKGYVGIGTHAPQYPLHITSSVNDLNTTPLHYLAASAGVGMNGSGWYYGIGVSGGVYSSVGFATGSDERIKTVIGTSDSEADLETLSKIQITDYAFKDQKKYGDLVTKKVIAQQVKSVYPKAVNLSADYIPNIYQVAKVQTDTKNKSSLLLDRAADVRVGEEIKLIDGANNEQYVTVIHVAGNRIQISSILNLDEVFVYGSKVNDFHNVDYDAISMLNVSATQELYRKIKNLEKENKALKERFDKRLSQLEAVIYQKEETGSTVSKDNN